jgi:hypothetical protein
MATREKSGCVMAHGIPRRNDVLIRLSVHDLSQRTLVYWIAPTER